MRKTLAVLGFVTLLPGVALAQYGGGYGGGGYGGGYGGGGYGGGYAPRYRTVCRNERYYDGYGYQYRRVCNQVPY